MLKSGPQHYLHLRKLVTLSHYRSTGEIWLSCRQGSAGKLFISFWKWKVRTSSKLYFREIVMHVNLILQDFGRKVASGSGKHYKLDGIRLMPTFIKTGLADIFTKERVLKILGPYWNALIVRWKFVNFSYKILYLRSTGDNMPTSRRFLLKWAFFLPPFRFRTKNIFLGTKMFSRLQSVPSGPQYKEKDPSPAKKNIKKVILTLSTNCVIMACDQCQQNEKDSLVAVTSHFPNMANQPTEKLI